jgi:hypothetical protein
MSWTAFTDSAKIQDDTMLSELCAAWDERAAVSAASEVDPPDTASSVQNKRPWRELFEEIDDHCGDFVKNRDAGGDVVDDFDGTVVAPDLTHNLPMWTSSDLWSYVTSGASSAGPRRYTTHPSDGGTPLYGAPQIGDIIGGWLVEDLRKAINTLVWTPAGYFPGSNRISKTMTGHYGSTVYGKNNGTWAEVYALCLASWTDKGNSGSLGITKLQQKYGTVRRGGLNRRSGTLSVYLPQVDSVNCEVDFYLHPSAYPGDSLNIFDDCGTGYAENALVMIEEGVAGTTSSSEYVEVDGTVDVLSPASTAPDTFSVDPPTDESYYYGFWISIENYVTHGAAIALRWDVTGGFEYVAS